MTPCCGAVTDVQSRYLGTAPEEARPHGLPLRVGDDLRDQAGFERAPSPPPRVLAAQALIRLGQIDHVGVTERLDAFAQQVASARQWPPPRPLPRANVAPGQARFWRLDELSVRERRMLDSVNRADHTIYRFAVPRFAHGAGRTRESPKRTRIASGAVPTVRIVDLCAPRRWRAVGHGLVACRAAAQRYLSRRPEEPGLLDQPAAGRLVRSVVPADTEPPRLTTRSEASCSPMEAPQC